MMVFHRRTLGLALLLVLALALLWVGSRYQEPMKVTWPFSGKHSTEPTAQPDADPDDAVPAMAPTSSANPGIVEQHRSPSTNAAYFASYRIDRERARSAQIELLKEIIGSNQTDAATRKDAQAQLLALRALIEKELMIENLLKGKGYQDGVFFFDHGIATVVVDAVDLNESKVVQISDIVAKISGVQPSEVIVIEKK